MAKVYKKLTCWHTVSFDDFEGKLDDVIARLMDWKEDYPFGSLELTVYDSEPEAHIHYTRLETETERDKRLAVAKKSREWSQTHKKNRAEQDRKLYEKLKERFGD